MLFLHLKGAGSQKWRPRFSRSLRLGHTQLAEPAIARQAPLPSSVRGAGRSGRSGVGTLARPPLPWTKPLLNSDSSRGSHRYCVVQESRQTRCSSVRSGNIPVPVGFGAQSHLVIHLHMSHDLVHTVRQESAHDEMHDRHLEQGAGASVQNTLLKALVQPGKVSARLVFQVVDRRPLYFDLIAIPVISDAGCRVRVSGLGGGTGRTKRSSSTV